MRKPVGEAVRRRRRGQGDDLLDAVAEHRVGDVRVGRDVCVDGSVVDDDLLVLGPADEVHRDGPVAVRDGDRPDARRLVGEGHLDRRRRGRVDVETAHGDERGVDRLVAAVLGLVVHRRLVADAAVLAVREQVGVRVLAAPLGELAHNGRLRLTGVLSQGLLGRGGEDEARGERGEHEQADAEREPAAATEHGPSSLQRPHDGAPGRRTPAPLAVALTPSVRSSCHRVGSPVNGQH